MTLTSSLTHMQRLVPNFAILFSILLQVACSKKEEQVTLTPSAVSGTISIRSNTQIDSDINDANSAQLSNNSELTAQSLPNPCELGGFVGTPGTANPGPLSGSGDSDDYYSVYLLVGQPVVFNYFAGSLSFSVREPNSASYTTITGSQFTAASEGTHIINIRATSGASNYTLGIATAVSTMALSTAGEADFVAGEIIVEYKQAKQAMASRSLSSQLISNIENKGFKVSAGHPSRSLLLSITDPVNRATVGRSLNIKPGKSLKQETLEVIAALKLQTDIADARPNYLFHASAIPNDTYYKYMWDVQLMHMEAAWEIEKGDTNPVIVAVLDTGVLFEHPDLNGKLLQGYDFIRDNTRSGDSDPGIDPDPQDPGDNPPTSSFHGTHVSGTVAAATNNGLGVPSFGWNIQVMPMRVLGRGGGTDYDIEQAILYAIGEPNDSGTVPAQPAQVINMSLGGPINSLYVPAAFKKAFQKNVFIVAAAGNDSSKTPIPYTVFPAGVPGVISVGAVGSAKTVADYSNYGSFLSLVAPGGDTSGADRNNDGRADWVLSTAGEDSTGTIKLGYGFEIGTSMASPHVAAVIGLMKSIYPELTPNEFQNWLTSGLLTDDIAPAGRDDYSGYGLLNAEKALNLAFSASAAANGIAKLAVNPSSLDFGPNATSLNFRIVNEGNAELIVDSVTVDKAWASVVAINVDANGVGDYRINVNRDGLASLRYSGSISIVSNGGNANIPFFLQSNPQLNNAGVQYVELKRTDDPSVIYTVRATYLNGSYGFAFNDINPGIYSIYSYSNLDGDSGTSCDSGESCGNYGATTTNAIYLNIKRNQPISDVNFTTGFNSTAPAPLQNRSYAPVFVEILD